MRLARQLAEEYGLETYGFDSPGIDDAVVTQFAAAIDDTLTRHPPLVLITLSIAELPEGELIRSSTDESADGVSGSHLVLSPIAARSLGPADERIAAERSAGQWPGTVDLPPVYALVIRELGYAMDAVGGYRARVAVREMEIPDQSGVPGDPAAVVAAAFAEVELTAAAAGPRSRALYRVLLDAADSARRSIEPR
ncbi:hypothetical protein [Nocardia sp. NPDC056000]|uniref:hypothetical protein n=1 Tax=Nocardia sp. NPDC056000 TaxID=3345674 RepID=UPI0035E34482